jgi:hypothetical protein
MVLSLIFLALHTKKYSTFKTHRQPRFFVYTGFFVYLKDVDCRVMTSLRRTGFSASVIARSGIYARRGNPPYGIFHKDIVAL